MTKAPTRHYFPKAVEPAPKPTKPNYHRQIVMASRVSPATGMTTYRVMSGREAAKQAGRAKGGQIAHAKGHAHRWTSKQASRAAKRMWRKYRLTRTGRHLGLKTKRRARVTRRPLREMYTLRPVQGIHYNPMQRQWWADSATDYPGQYRISERTALSRLGYIPHKTPRKTFVPETVTRVQRGKPIAVSPSKE